MVIIGNIAFVLFIVFFGYYIVYLFYHSALTAISLFEGRKRFGEYKFEDYTTLIFSEFSLPVSILIPAHNEEYWILDSVKSALNLSYPEFEVIVIDDGSTDKTPELLQQEFGLEPVERSVERSFPYGKVRQVFASKAYPNLTLVSKEGGFKKAGALDAGLAFARYSYVCVMDADTIVEANALLRVMAHVTKDAENIIAIGSYFGIVNGFKIKDGWIIERSFSYKPLLAYQNLEYLRSFVINRPAWSRFNVTPIIAGCFAIWRKDILLELDGFSVKESSEDVEFTFRAQDYILEKGKKDYKILMLPYIVGWTEGPDNLASFFRQRARWQRVVDETVWKYRHTVFNTKHGLFALLTAPYYLLYESLNAFIEAVSIILVTAGWLAGVLNLKIFLAYFVLLAISQVLISLFSVFALIRDQKFFRAKDALYFIILSFLEFFWYHWLNVLAKISGTFGYLRGITTPDQYKRSKR